MESVRDRQGTSSAPTKIVGVRADEDAADVMSRESASFMDEHGRPPGHIFYLWILESGAPGQVRVLFCLFPEAEEPSDWGLVDADGLLKTVRARYPHRDLTFVLDRAEAVPDPL